MMPSGLKNALSTFQKFMHDVFHGFSEFYDICLDDILVFSKSFDQNLAYVKAVLHRLYDIQMQAKCSKCEFLCLSLYSLGHTFFC